MNEEECKQFLADRTRNPLTGRPIKFEGPKYNELMRQCKKYLSVETNTKPSTSSPSSRISNSLLKSTHLSNSPKRESGQKIAPITALPASMRTLTIPLLPAITMSPKAKQSIHRKSPARNKKSISPKAKEPASHRIQHPIDNLSTKIIKPQSLRHIRRLRTSKQTYEGFVKSKKSFEYFSGNFNDITMETFIETTYMYGKDREYKDVMQIIMCELSFEEIYDLILTLLGFDMHDILRLDQCYNLLWYLHNVQPKINERPLAPLTRYFKSYDTRIIWECLGPHYDGFEDVVSIIFAFITGYRLPDEIAPNVQYSITKEVQPCVANALANMVHNFLTIRSHQRRITTLPSPPPYIYISKLELSNNILPIILSINMHHLEESMQEHGFVSTPWKSRTNQYCELEDFLFEVFFYYDQILTRGKDIGPPPFLNHANIGNISNILKKYTLKELIDAYEPGQFWMDRNQLIDVIIDESSNIPKWGLRNRYCNNDTTNNVVTLNLHKDMNKYDPNNMTLSYGVRGNYRCYQIDELIESFRQYDGVSRFRVPDWTNESPDPRYRIGPIDPTTGQRLPEEFPLRSIYQLSHLLHLIEVSRVFASHDNKAAILLNIILDGLKTQRTRKSLKALKEEYNTFNDVEQELINLYLAWVFICSMWMRFWLGPKYSWADVRYDMANEKALVGHRCVPTKREKHIIIQREVYNLLMFIINEQPKILQWVSSLPELSYNFTTNLLEEQPNTLDDVLSGIFFKNECMGFGGDKLIQSAYGIITTLHPNTKGNEFTQYIAKYFPEISKMERKIVEDLLQQYAVANADQWTQDMLATLKERQKELAEDLPILRQFFPERVGYTPHTA